jgi:hypothetical protein
MVQKVINALSVLAFLISASLAGGSFLLYRHITSPDFQKEIKEKLMKEVTGSLKIPELSGPVLPTAAPKAGTAGMSLPKF